LGTRLGGADLANSLAGERRIGGWTWTLYKKNFYANKYITKTRSGRPSPEGSPGTSLRPHPLV
jgi:hypothetical protein